MFNKKEMPKAQPLIFFNTPVTEEENDIIGVHSQVERLSKAIDSTAQLIAVTSPFGAGKTSIIELLRSLRTKESFKKRVFEKIITVSMWSHLQGQEQESSIALHRTFLYQLISQINPRYGTYLVHRLNPSYGLLRFHTNKRRYWFLSLFSLVLLIFIWLLRTFPDLIQKLIPTIDQINTDWFVIGGSFIAIFFIVLSISLADIIFSSRKSESERKIEVDELVDLYHQQVLKPRFFLFKYLPKEWHIKTYIIIIEDLDRTSNPDAVISFLTELRKYCTAPGNSYFNKAVFVINIKPESLLRTASLKPFSYTNELQKKEEFQEKTAEDKEDEEAAEIAAKDKTIPVNAPPGESLYAKIFDFVLNLQTINIDNYSEILEGLLQAQMQSLTALGLKYNPNDISNSLPGMQWIIRDRRIGVREIKERLNITFSLFESLLEKFTANGITPDQNSTLEKCAVVSYLSTAFEQDFYRMNGREFGTLIDKFIKSPSSDYHACDEVFPYASDEYRKTVWELIENKIIDSSYRSYFYNYPKRGRLYSTDELTVIDALLYKERAPALESTIQRCIGNGSTVIADSYARIKSLNLELPDIVLEIENLYLIALQQFPDSLFKKIENLNYSGDAFSKTVSQIIRILSFDPARKFNNAELAASLCKIWENALDLDESSLAVLRQELCLNYPTEIEWFAPLFKGSHPIISEREFLSIPFLSAMRLINVNASGFSVTHVQLVCTKFMSIMNDGDYIPLVQDFLSNAIPVIGKANVVNYLLDFMIKCGRIIREFDNIIFELLDNALNNEGAEGDETTSEEQDVSDSPLDEISLSDAEKLFAKYQGFINQIAQVDKLDLETLKQMSALDKYEGYNSSVIIQFKESDFNIDYVLLALCQNEHIPFDEQSILKAIQSDANWLLKSHEDLFISLRTRITAQPFATLTKYKFLFSSNCPIISKEELNTICKRSNGADKLIISLIPPSLVTLQDVPMLAKFFSRRHQPRNSAIAILEFLCKLSPEVALDFYNSLDFNSIEYLQIATAHRENLQEKFKAFLDLETAEGRLKFMKTTKCLIPSWELELPTAIKGVEPLEKLYYDTINVCDSITPQTIAVLTQLSNIYSLKPDICEELYKAKQYYTYVSAKSRWDNVFTMETGERGETLWPIYLKMFSNGQYNRTRDYMSKNLDFLNEIMRRKAYVDMTKEVIKLLQLALQTAHCLQFVFGFGESYALEYYLSIAGFVDKEAAVSFLNIVKGSPTLLNSTPLYSHTYDMLVDPTLKGRYTTMRRDSK